MASEIRIGGRAIGRPTSIKHSYHEVPSVPLPVTTQRVPCATCRARVAKGLAPLTLHPACAAHLP